MPSKFLTAEWNNLIMANYEIDPAILLPYLPAHTELDDFNGKHYVSLIGFMFEDVKLKGIPIPFHRNFPEVNLRFYVKHFEQNEWKRGVVFISEIVPLIAISTMANLLYHEHYRTLSMRHSLQKNETSIDLAYKWKYKNQWHSISATGLQAHVPIIKDSEEDFITSHFWGYSRYNLNTTFQYRVDHPAWNIYPLQTHSIHVDFKLMYGNDFAFLDHAKPQSIFIAVGSPISIYSKTVLK